MIYGKSKTNEEGFLLLDSLATLSIIMIIILFLNPLITDWLSQRQKAKDLVEETRLIYEESMEINNRQIDDFNYRRDDFQLENYEQRANKTGLGVRIYDGKFEYE